MQLLDVVGDDFRDGLFIACLRINSEELDRKLIRKFPEWEEEGAALHDTGNIYALQQFLTKWLKRYPYSDLEKVVKLYFRHKEQN
jgi:hypothetical protein